jgi:hypothetical protein
VTGAERKRVGECYCGLELDERQQCLEAFGAVADQEQ